ncbi:hypothetical protein BafPKo_J0007 (plasmid) [Borreliella afzelii PKo]|uniref:Uncharacterized protein n=1 Tax=Borreliella afzelii (strain PKo) TaxID=390236 RepID=Q0SLJ4_BORAP|nr:hypothetical protein BAPKO_3028 [Borreliella afzelii PKo]AEL70588.1 hypothetical protein BafPKo_J0007 [Borreliella afzelii PKo]AJY73113.1 hypothetical protein BAFK78_J006 [Borreliella afzelii K78]
MSFYIFALFILINIINGISIIGGGHKKMEFKKWNFYNKNHIIS